MNILVEITSFDQIIEYIIWFVGLLFYPKVVPVACLLAVQSQLALYKNRIDLKKDSQLRFTHAFRVSFISDFGSGIGLDNMVTFFTRIMSSTPK